MKTRKHIIDPKHQLVVKDNRLMEAKFQFSLWEMRLFERMVSLVEKGDTEFRLCRIYIKDLMAFFHSKSHNDYELIRDATKSLAYKKLNIPYRKDGKKRWAIISVFPTVTTPDAAERDGENAYVELEFHRDLRPYLLDLKERFKSYDIRNIQRLKSIYSIRLFILLKQYENIGNRYFDLAELKEILSIAPTQYTHYGSFKQRVILRPQKEIAKHCDIRFDFKEEKKGKKVIGLTFLIYPNEPSFGKLRLVETPQKQEVTQSEEKLKEPIEVEPSKHERLAEIHSKVSNFVTEDVAASWLSEYPAEQVEAGIDYTIEQLKKGMNIQNVGGYLNKMVQQSNLKQEATFKQTYKSANQSNYQETLAKEAAYDELLLQHDYKLLQIIEQISNQAPEKMVDLQSKALEKARAILPTAKENSQMVKAQFQRLLKEAFPDAFTELKIIEKQLEAFQK